MIYITKYNSPIGLLYLSSENNYLIGLWIENQKYFFSTINAEVSYKDDIEIFIKTKNWLDRYFNNEQPKIKEIDILLKGSVFRKDVWDMLLKIPYGKTTTYKEIAIQLAKKYNIRSMSTQAVGGAVGHNPISIIVPCHRVIGTNGSLTGYAGGIDKKQYLLKHEGIIS